MMIENENNFDLSTDERWNEWENYRFDDSLISLNWEEDETLNFPTYHTTQHSCCIWCYKNKF